MAKTDYISLQKLQQIASGTALMNGLVPVSREEISRMYYQNEKKLLPILKKCDAGTIWVLPEASVPQECEVPHE